jgi:hypothetical protein
VVVDNTNPSPEDRRPLIELGRAHGARAVGHYFDAGKRGCVECSGWRSGRARVPDAPVHATEAKLVPPSCGEGFDGLFVGGIAGDGVFEVRGFGGPDPGCSRGRV